MQLILVEHDPFLTQLFWFAMLVTGVGIMWYVMKRKKYPKDD